MLKLNNLRSPKGSHSNSKRIGRGQGSGQGTQAGKGHKGQKARSGKNVRTGFEGGNMPLYMRLPKRGFKNEPFREHFAIVNLDCLEEKVKGDIVSRASLIQDGILKGINKSLPIKILGNGDLTKALTFTKIEKLSARAREVIIKAGGKVLD